MTQEQIEKIKERRKIWLSGSGVFDIGHSDAQARLILEDIPALIQALEAAEGQAKVAHTEARTRALDEAIKATIENGEHKEGDCACNKILAALRALKEKKV